MPVLLAQHPIRSGSHLSRDHGMSALELVAWLAGESHSDRPACMSPVIAAVVGSLNDAMPNDSARSYYLRILIPCLVNTQASDVVEASRTRVVIDTVVRKLLPMLLRKQGRNYDASELASLRPIETTTGIVLAGLAALQESGNARVCWAAKKSATGGDPFVWAPIVAEIISEIGTPEAYEAGVKLIRCLIRTGDLVTSVSPAQKTVPPTA